MEAEGLLKFLKPYQCSLCRLVWANKEDGVTTDQGHKHLHTLEDTEVHRSRASVTFFLNDMVEDGILRFTEKTGKGGYHRVYYPHPNVPCEESFKQEMAMRMVKVAGELVGATFIMKQKPVA